MSQTPQTKRDFIADHVRSIPRSGIRDFFDIVQSMDNVISLGIGEPGFVTPWHIREAGIYALERGRTSYTSNYGLIKLRRAIARYLTTNYALTYDPTTEILVTVGVSEAMDVALRAIINPGDEILYHEPCYVSYHPSIGLCGGVPCAIATRPENHFSLTADDVQSAITSKTKAIILSFPTNPTGATLGAQEVAKIAKLCVEHDLAVITDEIYSELTYTDAPHRSIAAEPGMKERTIFLHGFSKAFASTPPVNILPEEGTTVLYALASRVIESNKITTSCLCSTKRRAFSITISATCTWRVAGSSKVLEITSPRTQRQ